MPFNTLDDIYDDPAGWDRSDAYLCHRTLCRLVDHALRCDRDRERLSSIDFARASHLVQVLAHLAVGKHPRRRALLDPAQLAILDSVEPLPEPIHLSLRDLGREEESERLNVFY